MGNILIRQPLPSAGLEYLDPFVLLHHGANKVEGDFKNEGVGPHPHRGFAPVSFIFKGGVHHRDSRGNNQAVYEGGTQWMNAGLGITHSERPAQGTNEMELIQMWVNIPAKNKMDVPSYYPLAKEKTPQYTSEDGLITAGVVSGELFQLKGPIPTVSPVNSAMLHAKKGGRLNVEIPSSHNAFLYLLSGKMNFNTNVLADALNMVVFANDGDAISLEVLEDSRALLMSGEPIGEQIFAQGPFVMNTEIEIMEAYRDFRMGKMGILIED